MSKRIFFATIIILALIPAHFFGQDERGQKTEGWAFSVEPVFGARLGQCKEILWNKQSSGGYYKISELVYDIFPAWYFGVNAGMRYKRFGLNFYSKFFVPEKCGQLTDSDWQNDAKYGNGDTTTKTDYSEHTLLLQANAGGMAGFDLELQADYKFYPTDFLTLSPLLSFNAQYISFHAKDGMGYYGKKDDRKRIIYPYDDIDHRNVEDFNGKPVINYDVYNLFLWSGVKADFFPCNWAVISLASELALYSIMFDYDYHITNGKYFFDITNSILFAFRQTIKAELKVKKNLFICQKTVFLFTGQSEGKSYAKLKKDDAYKQNVNSKAGGQMICVDLELSLKFSW